MRKVLSFKNLKAEKNFEVTFEQYSKDEETPEDSLKTKITHLNFEVLQFLLKVNLIFIF